MHHLGAMEIRDSLRRKVYRKPGRLNGPATDIPHVLHVNRSCPVAQDIRQPLGATLDEPLPRRILTATHMHVAGARGQRWVFWTKR